MIERTVITQFYYLQIYDNKDMIGRKTLSV